MRVAGHLDLADRVSFVPIFFDFCPYADGLPRAFVSGLRYVLPVAKRSRASKGQDAGSNADLKRCRRAIRSLNLVDSRLGVVAWGEQVSKYVGKDAVTEWYDVYATDHEQVYDFSYSSFERATHFSVGWRSWPLTAECEWMLPRLRDALTRSGQDSPFLVEVGAGAGAAAAIISAALQVPVIAIDSHPRTLGLAEQFASRAGGQVESRISELADMDDVLNGTRPAAVFGMGIYRHLQPHKHNRSRFSDWAAMQDILANHSTDPQVDRFINALQGADLLAEQSCPDYLAEVAAGLFTYGYDIPASGIARIDGSTPEGPTTAFGMHFSTANLVRRNPNLLVEMFSPLPRVETYSEPESGKGVEAEALRLSLEPTELIEASEIDYADGSGRMRREVFRFGNRVFGQYFSATWGFRSLRVLQERHLETALQQLRTDEAELVRSGRARVQPCAIPAHLWDTQADKPTGLALFAQRPI